MNELINDKGGHRAARAAKNNQEKPPRNNLFKFGSGGRGLPDFITSLNA